MFKQLTAKMDRSLIYKVTRNNISISMNKLVNHFPPPLYIKIQSGKKNDKTNHWRACPLKHKRTIQIKVNHYTDWS